MYPRISDFINDMFGTHLDLPIQSYGFFLASAFLAGAFFLHKELHRLELSGFAHSTRRKVITGKKAGITELLSIFLISLLIGFKLTGLFFDYAVFQKNPQDYLFSSAGSLTGGLIVAGVLTLLQFYLKKQKSLPHPIEKEIVVHAADQTWMIVFIAVIFGIIGAKIFHQLENWDDFMNDPIGSMLSFSGLTFYGGLIVAAIAVAVYAQKNGIPWKRMADAIAPSLILAYGIGRIGCQVSGDGDWGIVNTAPMPEWIAFLPDWIWAYDYPHNILNRGIPIEGCSGPHCFKLAEPVFPTPIYETTMSVIIFLFLWFIRKKMKIAGLLFAIYLMFNGMERFLIEKIRVNNVFDLWGLEVTQAEVISTLIFLGGLVLAVVLLIHQNKKRV